jgi:hypothetical protein
MTSPRVSSLRCSSATVAGFCLAAALLGAGIGWLAPSSRPDRPSAESSRSNDSASPLVSLSSALATAETAAPLAVAPWADRWESTLSLASTPARTRALAALLEELARSEPQRALALAQAQADWRLRDLLRDASLRGWAATAPDAAGDWALNARLEDRRAIVGAVLQGAAEHPAAAISLALRLCASDPEPAGDYGHAAIAALVDAGAFAEAARFGAEVGPEKYPFLLKSAYFEWARHDPAGALAAAAQIEDPVLAGQAKSQAITGWSWADAAGLAQHALELPPGAERSQALAESLPLWLERYPEEAAIWIQKNDSGPEFDPGLAALANQQSFLKSRPAAALDLASGIADPAKRKETLTSVFGQWAARDPRGARAYLASAANAADRATLAATLADVFPDGAP